MAVSHSTHPVTPELLHSSFAQVLHADGPDIDTCERARTLFVDSWADGSWTLRRSSTMERLIGAAARFTQVGCCRAGLSRTSG